MSNYAFVDVYRNTGAPYYYKYDLIQEVSALKTQNFDRDYDFHVSQAICNSSSLFTGVSAQQALALVMARLNDAHTQYFAPDCYGSIFAFQVSHSCLHPVADATVAIHVVQPVFVKPVFVQGVMKLISTPLSISGENVATRFEPRFPLNREVVRIDGMDVVAWVLQWARENLGWTNDPSGSFNAAVARLQAAVRPLVTSGIPRGNNLTYTLRDSSGVETDVAVPWQFLVRQQTHNATQFARLCQRAKPPAPVNCTDPVPPTDSPAGARTLHTSADHTSAVVDTLTRLHDQVQSETSKTKRSMASGAAVGSSAATSVEEATRESLRHLRDAGVTLDNIATTAARHAQVLRRHGGRPHMVTSESAAQARGADFLKEFAVAAGPIEGGVAQLGEGQSTKIRVQGGSNLGRALGAESDGEGDVLVTRIFDRSSTLGLSLFNYNDELTGSSADMLSINTFNPPLVSSCFAEITSTPCPTAAQEAAADACYSAGLNAFLTFGSLHVLEHVQDTGSSLIIDLVGNGGGNVVLGQLLLVSLFTDLARNPLLASPAYDFHQDLLQSALGEFSKASGKQLPGFSFNGLLLRNGQSVSNLSNGAIRDMAWYSPGVQVARGARGLQPYSQEAMLVDLKALIAGVPLPPDALTPERTMLVSDLQCGSMCGQFSHMLVEAGLAKVLGLGGVPWLGSDSTAFTGGYIISDAESITRTYEAAKQVGFSIPPGSGIVEPVYFPTSAGFSMNFGAMVSTLHPPFHTQMVALKPSARLMEWTQGSMSKEQAALTARLEAVVPLTPLSANSRVGQYVLVKKEQASKTASTVAITMSVLFALTAIIAIVLGALLYKARSRSPYEVQEAYPSLSRRDGGSSGSGWSTRGGATVAQLP